jgi:hypothetical protein
MKPLLNRKHDRVGSLRLLAWAVLGKHILIVTHAMYVPTCMYIL